MIWKYLLSLKKSIREGRKDIAELRKHIESVNQQIDRLEEKPVNGFLGEKLFEAMVSDYCSTLFDMENVETDSQYFLQRCINEIEEIEREYRSQQYEFESWNFSCES